MERRDRRVNLALFGAALVAWLVVGAIVLTLDPNSDPGVAYLGAAAIGVAFGLTTAPLFWLIGFARQRRIAYRGDWTRALRRAGWVGGLAAVLVLLRLEGLFQAPIALFLVALAIVAEVTISTRA
ncbi:MAG TPA: hypothetical protein VFW20_07420 [Candidatus Limnocylindrales bacterium]|nr:hypothetical protein [Candidatus Limnocylindrales bacterium]